MSYSDNGGNPFNMNVVPAGGYGGDGFLGGNGAWWLLGEVSAKS